MVESSFILAEQCIMKPFTKSVKDVCAPFSCGNGQIEKDLNDFFENEADLYREELLGKTYCWITKEEPRQIIGLFTISNDSIKTTYLERSTSNRLNRSINNAKRGRSYPAVLIGRLGVNEHFQGGGRFIGTQILDILKDWFTDENNKTGCRFMVVDAHNHPRTLHFYQQNGFNFLHKTEDEEREYYHIADDEPIHTRLMYFDLKKHLNII